jgi:hypothetical protein
MLLQGQFEIRLAQVLGSDAVDHLGAGAAGYGASEHVDSP